MVEHTRVLVIGGGVMGVSLLYHLAKLGWHDVTLVEKNDLTHGSTWHAAGLCTHFAHNPTIMEMRATSIRLYRSELEAETGQPTGFCGTGALRVTREPDRIAEFRHVQGIARFMGYDLHIITPDELGQLHPLANTGDGLVGAIYEPDDGNVDPSQATLAMAAAARARGARILRNNPVIGIEKTRGGEWRVQCRTGEIVAEHIVNAAGTWCREIGEMIGLDLPVVPMLHQYLVTEDVAEVAALEKRLPIIRDPEESWYCRQERDGLICGPYEKEAKPWSVDGVPPSFGADLLPPDLDAVIDIVDCAMNRVPALAEAGIKTIVNGPITFTPDGNPLIGPAFQEERAWVLTGSSMGVMEGGGAGRYLAEWIIGGEPPMDPIAVDSRRFGGYADRDYRVAKARESFALQFGIHYPYEERSAGRPCTKSGIHAPLAAAGAVFGAVYGWERPNWFATPDSGSQAMDSFARTNWFPAVAQECRAVDQDVALADLSAFAKFEVSGADAEAFMATLGANKPPVEAGRVALVHVLSRSGGVLSEFSVTRLSGDRYYLVSAAAAARRDLDLLRARADGHRVHIRAVTAERGVLAIAGPRARSLIEGASGADLSPASCPRFTARSIEIAGTDLLALRVSYVGGPGWELHVPADRLKAVYAHLHEANDGPLSHYGAFAMNGMRLEQGYRAWGMDLTTERTPLEAGLPHLVKTDGRTFVGRDSLLRRAESHDRWRMELLEVGGDGPDPFYAHPVLREDNVVGMITSGAFGHRLGKKLALAYFRDGAAPRDDDLETSILGSRYPVSVIEPLRSLG